MVRVVALETPRTSCKLSRPPIRLAPVSRHHQERGVERNSENGEDIGSDEQRAFRDCAWRASPDQHQRDLQNQQHERRTLESAIEFNRRQERQREEEENHGNGKKQQCRSL